MASAPQGVQDRLARLLPFARRGGGQDGVSRAPDLLGRAQLVEGIVAHAQQADLLQVGGRDAPAAPQIVVEAVADRVAQRRRDLLPGQELGVGVRGVLVRLQAQLRRHGLRHGVVREPLRAGRRDGGV